MDGYEDLPILLSVIQSNKVNIYCIYIKNYPGSEWRRVAFIGAFPGVRSPRMERVEMKERAGARALDLCKLSVSVAALTPLAVARSLGHLV